MHLEVNFIIQLIIIDSFIRYLRSTQIYTIIMDYKTNNKVIKIEIITVSRSTHFRLDSRSLLSEEESGCCQSELPHSVRAPPSHHADPT